MRATNSVRIEQLSVEILEFYSRGVFRTLTEHVRCRLCNNTQWLKAVDYYYRKMHRRYLQECLIRFFVPSVGNNCCFRNSKRTINDDRKTK